MCSIMALKKEGVSFNPFFQHRLTEIQANLKDIAKSVGVLEPVRKIDGLANPADIGTRDNAKPEDMKPNGVWFKGPSWLSSKRETWPLSED